MISNKFRFHGHGSLKYVFANGLAIRSSLFTVKYATNPRRHTPRLSVVVSKKVLKSAVGRNRIRRRLYELGRTEILPNLKNITDVVIITTSSEVATLPATELKTVLTGLFEQANLLK